jgi:hypothetical protein
MKVKTLSALAGVGSALILSSAADASYQGLTVVKHTTAAVQGIQRDVYRVYAMFSDPGDFLTSVAGSPTLGNMIIETRNSTDTGAGGNFVNPPGGGSTAPTFYALGTQIEWDTFVDIGLASVPYGGIDATGLSPGFAGVPNGGLNTDNAGWFTTGGVPQGMAGNGTANVGGSGNWGVLMLQLTVNAGNNVRGTVNVGGINNNPLAGGTTFQTNSNGQGGPQAFNSAEVIPAPGVLALVGIAGLVGASRRRRG